MRRISVVLLAVAAIACFATMANAGEGKAETSVHGTIFGNWAMDLTDGANNANAFDLGRAYFTVKSKLSENTSGKVTFDFTPDDDRYDVLVKHAYIDWKPTCLAKDFLKIRFGLQSTMYFSMMNGLWGHRYVAKTVSDANGFLTSADMGVTMFFALGQEWKFGYAGLAILNGAGFKDVGEANKQKDINLFAKITPLQDNPQFKGTTFGGQFYKGTQNEEMGIIIVGTDTTLHEACDWKREIVSFGGLLAFDDKIDVGGEYNALTLGDGPGADALKSTAMSFFGTLYLSGLIQSAQALHTLNVFASYGMYDPNTDFDDDGDKTILVGLECAPKKGIKTSFTYSTKSYDDDDENNVDAFVFNTMVSF